MANIGEQLSNLSKKLPLPFGKKTIQTGPKRRLGLNIGRAAFVGVEVSQTGDKIVLERCFRKEIVEGQIDDQLKTFISEHEFQSKAVNTSLKGQGVVVRFLNFPRMNKSDFASSIQFEAEKYLPFNLSEVVVDFYINEPENVKASGQSMPVILVAARKSEVKKVSSIVSAAGLQLSAIDVDTFACANAFENSTPELRDKAVGLIDFGARDTTFMIWDRGRLVFSRDIAFGGEDSVHMIKRRLNVGFDEAMQIQCNSGAGANAEHEEAIKESLDRMFHELRLSLNYYYNQRQNAPQLECILISGGFSQLRNLPQLLEKNIEIEVRMWDPTAQMTMGPNIDRNEVNALIPYLPVSVGLAIRST